MQYWRQSTSTGPVNPNLAVIESMMYGCRVAEVVDILRTLDTPVQVCDALAEERAFVAEQLAAYLEALAARRQARPTQPPQPPGPPPGRARLSPEVRGRHPPLPRSPPGTWQRRVNLHRSPPGQRRRRPLPRPPPRWTTGGPPDPLYEAWGDLAPPIAPQPRPSSSVGLEVAPGRGASVHPSPYTDVGLHGKGQGGATRTPGAVHQTHGTAQDRGAGRGQRRQRSASRVPARTGKAAPGGASCRPAGQQPAGLAAGAPARGATTVTSPTRGAPPAGPPPPAAGDPWARREHVAPPAGECQGLLVASLTQEQVHFEHREFGPENPKGDSWPEKMNVRSTRIIANDQREARLHWETTQVGNLWRASPHVMPRLGHLRQDWEQTVTYTGGLFCTKRNAKEDACRLLLQAQQRAGRLPDLLPPGQEAAAPDQGAAAQQAPSGSAQQAGPEKPRPQTRVHIAKTPPPGAGVPRAVAKAPPSEAAGAEAPPVVAKAPPPEAADDPPGLQQGLPSPAPAAGQDPGAGSQPQGSDAEAPAGSQGGAGPSEAGPAHGGLDSDAPGSLTGRLLLPETTPPERPARLGRRRKRGGDFLESDPTEGSPDDHTPTEVEGSRSGEEEWVAARALREQEKEARAALDPMQVPVPEETEEDLLAGDNAGAAEWLGGLDPKDPSGMAQGFPRLPLSPDSRPPLKTEPGEEA